MNIPRATPVRLVSLVTVTSLGKERGVRQWRAQSMRWAPMILAAVSLLGSAAAVSQGQGQVSTPEVPPTDTIAEGIPGVVSAGTKIGVVIANVPGHGDPGVTLQGTEGPIAL